MPIILYCEKCATKNRAPDNAAGRTGQCSACGHKMEIPAKSMSEPPAIQMEDAGPEPMSAKEVAAALPGSIRRPKRHTTDMKLPPARRTASRPVERNPASSATPKQGLHVGALVCSIGMLIGCFLPALKLGPLLQIKYIDTDDGKLMLGLGLCGIVASALSLSATKGRKWPYIVVGLLGTIVAGIDLNDVESRVREAAQAFNALSVMGGGPGVDTSQFIGEGLWVALGCSITLLALGLFVPSSAAHPKRTVRKTKTTLCADCGKYFEGRPRFCPNCGQSTPFA